MKFKRFTPGAVRIENVSTRKWTWYTPEEQRISTKASFYGQDSLTPEELQTYRDSGAGIVRSFPISRKGDRTREDRFETLCFVADKFADHERSLVRLGEKWQESVINSRKSAKVKTNVRGKVCTKELNRALASDEAQAIVADTQTAIEEIGYVTKKISRAAHYLSDGSQRAFIALYVIAGSFTNWVTMRLGYQGPGGGASDYLTQPRDLVGLHDMTNFTGLKHAIVGFGVAWLLKKIFVWSATKNAYNLANEYNSKNMQDHVITVLNHPPGTPAYEGTSEFEGDRSTRDIQIRSTIAYVDLDQRMIRFWQNFWNQRN